MRNMGLLKQGLLHGLLRLIDWGGRNRLGLWLTLRCRLMHHRLTAIIDPHNRRTKRCWRRLGRSG